MRKRICMCKNKGEISFIVTAKLISAFVFSTLIVQFLYFVNPKFPASSHLISACTARFVSNLFEKHIVGFFMSQLLYSFEAAFLGTS